MTVWAIDDRNRRGGGAGQAAVRVHRLRRRHLLRRRRRRRYGAVRAEGLHRANAHAGVERLGEEEGGRCVAIADMLP